MMYEYRTWIGRPEEAEWNIRYKTEDGFRVIDVSVLPVPGRLAQIMVTFERPKQ